MQEHSVTLPLNGKDTEVFFKDDIPWADFKTILKSSMGENGLDFDQFSDRLIKIAARSETFDFTNLTEVGKVGSKEMTAVLGKMLDVLPLEIWLSNLGVGKGKSLDKILDQKIL
jgi:hypothetical protein